MVEWLKRGTLRWFGHIERMGNEEFDKEVYLSSVECTNRRGRSLGRWEHRVREYLSGKEVTGNTLEWARRECMGRERCRSVCRDQPHGGHSRRERGVSEVLTGLQPIILEE